MMSLSDTVDLESLLVYVFLFFLNYASCHVM